MTDLGNRGRRLSRTGPGQLALLYGLQGQVDRHQLGHGSNLPRGRGILGIKDLPAVGINGNRGLDVQVQVLLLVVGGCRRNRRGLPSTYSGQ